MTEQEEIFTTLLSTSKVCRGKHSEWVKIAEVPVGVVITLEAYQTIYDEFLKKGKTVSAKKVKNIVNKYQKHRGNI